MHNSKIRCSKCQAINQKGATYCKTCGVAFLGRIHNLKKKRQIKILITSLTILGIVFFWFLFFK